ncbi:MAG: OmpA family protein [Planctomycetaceae bacterium]
MPTSLRIVSVCVLAGLMFSQTACSSGSAQHLRQSQLMTRQLYNQNRSLASRESRSQQTVQAMKNQHADLEKQLSVANQRVDNYASESAQLKERYVGLLNRAKNQPSPLSAETTRRFQELERMYPGFDFDPETGVSKFHSDVLFSTGSDQIASRGTNVLDEFAKIMNSNEAKRLNILVVGHTDDRRIAKGTTRQKHPTNWHLSTNRANSVVVKLSKSGIADARMGVAGYSMYQPTVPNKDDKSRSQNRRVEIFVLAPDAVVAGWDPGKTRK